MSKVNDLIKELCPNGVKKYTIKDICLVTRGRVISKMELQEKAGEYPVYSSQTLNNGVFGKINSYDFDGEYVQWTTDGANAGSIFYRNGKFSVTNVCGLLKVKDEYLDKINTNYLAYALTMESKKYVNYATSNPKLMSNVMAKINVLIPPLEIQKEIVRILDKFGELEAELETELEARKSQYEFWRGKLLFNPNYPVYKMEDICIINQGLQIPINQRKKEPGENRYFYITVQFLKNEGENYYIENPSESVICKKDDILVTRTGSTGKIVYGVEGCFHNNFFKVTPTIELNKRYLYHVLNSTQMFNEMLRVASGGTVPDLPHKKFYKLEIGLPEIDEQNRIVNILDKFDALVNDITVGLPAEIELRRKQYEYYRNKLLSFEELSVSE